MSDENLAEGLNQSYREHQREVAIKHLGSRTRLSLGQIAALCGHDEHGDVVASITLQELIDVTQQADGGDEASSAPAAAAKKTPAKTAAKKPSKKAAKTKKTPAKKKAAKKPAAKKKPAKKKAAKKSTKRGPKADKGKPKPRLDYDQGKREILAALKAAKADGQESLGRSALEEATGFSGVQVRTFCKKLAEEGKVQILGEGGRSTTYAVA